MAEQATRLKTTDFDGMKIVEFSDRKILDELCILEIQEELSRVVDQTPGIRLVLSFKNVEHLSSAALGMLITLRKKVEEGGGRLRLSDINPQIFEVFKITRLNKVFDIYPTIDKAREGF